LTRSCQQQEVQQQKHQRLSQQQKQQQQGRLLALLFRAVAREALSAAWLQQLQRQLLQLMLLPGQGRSHCCSSPTRA
jgi:hypothetical protein